MKNLLPFLLIPFFFACTQAEKQGATINGKVTNLASGFFILGGPGGIKDSIKLDATGRFTHAVPVLKKMTNYFILVGSQDYMPCTLGPGMDLDVAFNAKDFKASLKFTGKGSDINNYLGAKFIASGQMDEDCFKLEPGPFRLKQDSLLSVQKTLLASTKKEDANDPFWKTEEAEVLFGWANTLAMYEWYHGYIAQIKDYKAPAEFFSYEKELAIDQPAYVTSSAFKEYVSGLVDRSAKRKMDELKMANPTQTINSSKIRMETALRILKNETVLDHYLFDAISSMVQMVEIEGYVQESIDSFLGKCKDTVLVNGLNRTVAEWKRFSKGQPAFEFSGKDMQGNTVKLSDFKGKYVYVDVWATWCGPCIGEIPYLDTLETDYAGRNIVFISYSIDEDYAAWAKFIPENKPQRIQIIGGKAWESDLIKNYKIIGVPTFMMFDTEGKIVSTKMTRPSDKKTRETFDGLL
jgi:thiol-disulfide isomerase/thioredoxin